MGTGEVLSLAPKQKKLSNVCATIDLLNQELSDFGYSSYTFLRGFTSHSAWQCALPDGYICKQEEGGYGLNPKLLDPLWRSIGTIQDVLDHLEASLLTLGGRRPFQVDSDYYWIHRIAQADELGKVLNATAAMHTKIQMACQHIQHTILLHQGQAVDEAEVDLMSHRDWGSMTSSPCLETLWNSPRNPVGEMIMEELRKELLDAMQAEERVDMGDTTVYPILNTKENRQVVTAWNGEVKRFESRTKLVHQRWEEVPEVRGAKGYLGIWVEGLSPGEGSQADSLSKEVSVQAKPGPEREEHSKPDSQEMSSRYTEETVASFSHGRGASSQHEVESPISHAFRMKHLAVPVPSAPHVSHSRTSDFVTGSYHPRSSIQLMRHEMTSKLPHFPPPALPPKYAPMFRMDDPFSSANKS